MNTSQFNHGDTDSPYHARSKDDRNYDTDTGSVSFSSSSSDSSISSSSSSSYSTVMRKRNSWNNNVPENITSQPTRGYLRQPPPNPYLHSESRQYKERKEKKKSKKEKKKLKKVKMKMKKLKKHNRKLQQTMGNYKRRVDADGTEPSAYTKRIKSDDFTHNFHYSSWGPKNFSEYGSHYNQGSANVRQKDNWNRSNSSYAMENNNRSRSNYYTKSVSGLQLTRTPQKDNSKCIQLWAYKMERISKTTFFCLLNMRGYVL